MRTVQLADPAVRVLAVQVATGCVCATLVWLFFVHGIAPADLEVFLRAGRTVRDGVSPYVASTSSQVWSGHSFVYPYLTAWCFVPLTWLHARAAEGVYYLASMAALVATVRITGNRRHGAVSVLLVCTAEPVVRALQLGTLNVWLLLGLAIAWRYRDRGYPVVISLTALIVAKLFLIPMLVWLLVTGRRRPMWQIVALSGALIVVGCAIADLPLTAFAHMLSALSAHEAPHSSSITAHLLRLDVAPAVATAVAAALALAIVAVATWRFRRTGDERVVFCGCIVASLVLSPIVWSHYLVLLLLIPLLWQWRARTALGVVAVTWLASFPVGAPALHALRSIPGAATTLQTLAVLVGLALALPTVRRVIRTRRARPRLER